MSRQSKRQMEREIKKIKPEVLEFIDKCYRLQCEEQLDIYKKLIDDAVFSAMRENRIGEDRSYRVMELANKYILEEMEKKQVS